MRYLIVILIILLPACETKRVSDITGPEVREDLRIIGEACRQNNNCLGNSEADNFKGKHL